MSNITFNARTLGKYLDAQVKVNEITIDLGPLDANEAKSLLAEVDFFRENLSAYVEITRPSSEKPHSLTDAEAAKLIDHARRSNTQAVALAVALEQLADAADEYGPEGGADGRALAEAVERALKTLNGAAGLLDHQYPEPAPATERLLDPGGPKDDSAGEWQWYTYCPEEGIELYQNRQQAQSAAQSIMGSYEVAAHSDGWHEDMELVSWGMVIPVEQAQVVERGPADPGGEFDEWVRYELREVALRSSPTPQRIADGELAELVETLKGIAYWKRHGKPGVVPAPFDIRQADRLDRAASLLERLSHQGN